MNPASASTTWRTRLTRVAACLSPNWLILVLVAGGCGWEWWRLEWGTGATRTFAVCWVLGFWLMVGWTAAAVARWAKSWPRRLLATLLLLVAGAAYAVSWAVYLRTRQFLGWEAMGFAVTNLNQLPQYIAQMEPAAVWRIGVVLGVAALALPGVLAWIAQRAWPVELTDGLRRSRRMITYLIALGWLGAALLMAYDKSDMRRPQHWQLIQYGVNPLIAWVASVKDAVLDERVEPCLATTELSPLPAAWSPAALTVTNRPSIILVAVESLRPDVIHLRHQGQEVMPNLNALARAGVQWTRAYAPSTHSDYSDVSVLSSLYPLRTRQHHYYRADDPWPKTLLYDLLQPAGYAAAIFSSQNEAWGGMDKFYISPHLDVFFDASRSGQPTRYSKRDSGIALEMKLGVLRAGNLDDAVTIDAALPWLRQCVARGTPYLLTVTFQDSHFPYELAADTPLPFQPCTLDFPMSFLQYPAEKVDVVRNAYYNALHESDRQLGRLVATLRELGQLEHTILVVYGENGECFHENGHVTHAREPVEAAVRVACVFHAPDQLTPRVDDYPFQLIDIAPTLLEMLKLPAHPNFQGIDAHATDRPAITERLLFFHTETPLSRVDAVLLAGRWKYEFDRRTGREALFDVGADPTETRDLVVAEPALTAQLRELYRQWRRRQLAYYYFPMYYTQYYPPRPPTINRTVAGTVPP